MRDTRQVILSALVIVLAAVIGVDQVRIDRLHNEQVVSVHVFGRILELPNNFAISWIGPNEIVLDGKQRRVTVGRRLSEDSLAYFRKGAATQHDVCGLSVIEGTYKGVWVKLVFLENGEYVGFYEVPPDIVERAISRLCRDMQGIPQ